MPPREQTPRAQPCPHGVWGEGTGAGGNMDRNEVVNSLQTKSCTQGYCSLRKAWGLPPALLTQLLPPGEVLGTVAGTAENQAK